jgi:hypothetical protein
MFHFRVIVFHKGTFCLFEVKKLGKPSTVKPTYKDSLRTVPLLGALRHA